MSDTSAYTHGQGLLNSTIGEHPVAAAAALAVLVLLVIILAFTLMHFKAKAKLQTAASAATTTTTVTTSTSPATTKSSFGNRSASGVCPAGKIARSYNYYSADGKKIEYTQTVCEDAMPTYNMSTCGRPWNFESSAEALALYEPASYSQLENYDTEVFGNLTGLDSITTADYSDIM